MQNCTEDRKLYIVLSQTGTFLSKLIRFYTGDEYNHVSIALSPSLQLLYSFGRRKAYNPFIAGFVDESPNYGTFKRFSDAKIMVLELTVDKERFDGVSNLLNTMYSEKTKYGYNHIGLWCAAINKQIKCKNRYFCSEFLKEVFERFEIEGYDRLKPIPHPVNFIDMPNSNQIYQGKLCDYCVQERPVQATPIGIQN